MMVTALQMRSGLSQSVQYPNRADGVFSPNHRALAGSVKTAYRRELSVDRYRAIRQ